MVIRFFYQKGKSTMQKSKGLFLLKGVLVLALVLAISGAQRAATARGIRRTATPRPGRVAGGTVLAGGRGTGVRAGTVITWMNLEEAAGKLQKEQRPILIDLYTTWCGWCRQMDKKTYSNKQVAAYVQEKFYPVKLDAETRAVLNWKGKEYRFNAGYRSNEFAVYLTHGQLEFPTTIIIPPGGEPQAIPGYMEPKELELLVKYFGEGKYDKVSFDEYQKSFRPSW
jgi:thioredoxin-related protein